MIDWENLQRFISLHVYQLCDLIIQTVRTSSLAEGDHNGILRCLRWWWIEWLKQL